MQASNTRRVRAFASAAIFMIAFLGMVLWNPARGDENNESPLALNSEELLKAGRQTFRYDTFGDEYFWGGALQLHQAIAGSKNGGVGPGVSPKTALAVGLKVDVEALPAGVVNALRNGAVNLDDPATTLLLLRNNAVVGVTGFFTGNALTSVGIQCALCHSTVDESFAAPGIPAGNVGRRRDGWAARDLNVGAIINLSPDLTPVANVLGVDQATVRKVINAWGPGKFDAELFLDGKGFRPDGRTAATLIPPAFGLLGLNLHTWTGWGSLTYWNAFVANLEMHGKGQFFDPRLNDPLKFPVATRNGFGDVRIDAQEDRITPKLAALHFYQLAIAAPRPKTRSQDPRASNGAMLFKGKARCATCHVAPLSSEPGWNMHTPAEVCVDNFQASRSPDERYRTSPLGGLFTHQKGGFYHDGRFQTLIDVVNHYNSCMSLSLTQSETDDIVAYLLTL